MYRHLGISLLVSLVACQFVLAGAQSSGTRPGDLIAEIVTPEVNGAVGKGIAYDGQYLYYTEWAGNFLHRIDVPPPGLSSPTGKIDIPIQGMPSGIMTRSYDAGRASFWAVGGDGLSIYLLDKLGRAMLRFTIDPTTDRPGNCKPRGALWTDGCPSEVKINYDGTDDTIWYAPDTSERIYHYSTIPDALGTAQLVPATPFVDVDVPPNDMYLECGYSQVSGVSVGGPTLLINIAGCAAYFEYTKRGTKVGSYPIQTTISGDTECDDRSYSVSVFWARGGWNGRIYAYQQPRAHACAFGGGH